MGVQEEGTVAPLWMKVRIRKKLFVSFEPDNPIAPEMVVDPAAGVAFISSLLDQRVFKFSLTSGQIDANFLLPSSLLSCPTLCGLDAKRSLLLSNYNSQCIDIISGETGLVSGHLVLPDCGFPKFALFGEHGTIFVIDTCNSLIKFTS